MLKSGENEKPNDAAIEDAATWFVRMNSHPVTDETKHAFHLWLQKDSAHQEAYDATGRLWEGLKEPARLAGGSGWYRWGSIDRFFPLQTIKWATFASIFILLSGAGALWRDPGLLERGFADYAAPPGTHREITLADGTNIYLDDDSAIDTRFDTSERHVELIRGRAWFSVAFDENRPFYVHAQDATVRVRGTVFAVEIEKGDTKVSVESGAVAVRSAADAKINLGPGNVAVVSQAEVHKLDDADIETMSSWRRGLIVMNQSPLETVIAEISRYTPGRVVLSDKNIGDLRLSGIFRTDDPDAVFSTFQSALGLKVRRIPGVLTLIYR